MKKIYSSLMLITLVSCSTDSNEIRLAAPLKTDSIPSPVARLATEFPNNSDNPYDYAGQVYTDLFDSYFESALPVATVADVIAVVDSLAASHSKFMSIKDSTYHSISHSRVQYILSNDSTRVAAILSTTTLSPPAKVSLFGFINSLVTLYDSGSDAAVLYDFVVTYELQIIENNYLSEGDKRILLITTSLARHAAVRPKKRPKKNTDPDWDLMIGNVMGGADGSSSGVAEAVTWSLVTGITQNTLPAQ